MTKENTALILLEDSLERLEEQHKLDTTDAESQEESLKRTRERIQKFEERMENIRAAIKVLKGDGQ